MIDLHVHLLPGVDDGPDDLAAAVDMCRLAAADGVTALVATPHQRHQVWANRDRAALERLHAELCGCVNGTLAVHLGAEICVDSELLPELDRLPAAGLLPLASSRYLLLELGPFPTDGDGSGARSLVHELMLAGWQPILSHPERIPWLCERPRLLPDLVDLGAQLQVTAMSVTGGFGRRPQRVCRALLDAGLVHFVASDGHGLGSRPPVLSEAYAAVSRSHGEDVARRLFHDNPAAVLQDSPLP